MALIRCSECNREISDKAAACPHCGCPIAVSIKVQMESKTVQKQEPVFTPSNDNISKLILNDIPMPKLSSSIILGIASIIGLITFILAIQVSVFGAFALVAFIIVFVAFIHSIKKYHLAKKDFRKYQEKIYLERKAEQTQKEAEQKKRYELEAKRAEYAAKGIPTCPQCGSPSIATINRGYSIVSGFIGSGKAVNVCQVCGCKWEIGK